MDIPHPVERRKKGDAAVGEFPILAISYAALIAPIGGGMGNATLYDCFFEKQNTLNKTEPVKHNR